MMSAELFAGDKFVEVHERAADHRPGSKLGNRCPFYVPDSGADNVLRGGFVGLHQRQLLVKQLAQRFELVGDRPAGNTQ